MKDRIAFNQIKGLFIIVLFIVLTIQSIVTNGQSLRKERLYRGLQANFGTYAFTLNSDIVEIDRSTAALAGGQFGITLGNKALRSRINVFGYYSSASKTKGTIDLYTSNASLNVYPLSLLKQRKFRVEPYLSGGVRYDRMKFHGFYLNQAEDAGPVNYSVTIEPHLGSVKQMTASVGAGLVIKIIDHYDFVHFFSEARYGTVLSSSASNEDFARTSTQKNIQFSAGLTFGSKR